jgi:hypothetical protein
MLVNVTLLLLQFEKCIANDICDAAGLKLSCVRLSVALFMLVLLACTALLSGDCSFPLRNGCRLLPFRFLLCWTLTRWSILIDLRDVTRAGLLSLMRLLLLAWLLPWLILTLRSRR